MLYLIHGAHTDVSLARRRELLRTFRAKRPDAHEVRLEGEEITADRLAELAGARGLFESKLIVLLDGACESAVSRDALRAAAPALARSESAFVVFERGAVDAATEKALATAAIKVFRGPASSAEGAGRGRKGHDRELFALADALGARDKKGLWVRYARARLIDGKAPEEIHGVLFWQARAMLLASTCASAPEAGLAPFPFSKAKRYAARYSEEKLRALAGSLVALYHDARRGIHDLDTALERFILEVCR